MDLQYRQLNPNSCCTYLVNTKGSNKVLLIDPVLKHLDSYLELLDKENLQLEFVIDTHTHADHISAGPALKDYAKCEYAMYQNAPAPCVTMGLKDGFQYRFGSIPFKVLLTPGHTKDSISLLFDNRIFTGDALFLDDGGAGRDDLPGGDPGEHWETLQKFCKLPDHLVVYPAHDYRNRQPSKLRDQKVRNPHLRFQTKNGYIKYLKDLQLGPSEWMKDVLKANQACSRDPNAARIPDDLPACEIPGTLSRKRDGQKSKEISVEELKGRIECGNSPILLDVRESQELEEELGHLPGILHIPIGKLASRLNELEIEKNKEIVTICRASGRAQMAAEFLMDEGFSHVSVLTGGMIAWNQVSVN